jgi:hypothetical protein
LLGIKYLTVCTAKSKNGTAEDITNSTNWVSTASTNSCTAYMLKIEDARRYCLWDEDAFSDQYRIDCMYIL